VQELAGNEEALQGMLAHAANYLIFKSLKKLQENVGAATDQAAGWNDTQVHYLNDAAIAFGHQLSAVVYFDQIQKARNDTGTYELLHKLYELYVLDKIERTLAVYREYDYLSFEQGDMVKERVRELSFELGESSLNIVESIANPDKFVASAIAQSDG
jgi:hypothetical protein